MTYAKKEMFGKWGFVNDKGEPICEFIYDEVRDYSENIAAVRINDKWGYIDEKGNQNPGGHPPHCRVWRQRNLWNVRFRTGAVLGKPDRANAGKMERSPCGTAEQGGQRQHPLPGNAGL